MKKISLLGLLAVCGAMTAHAEMTTAVNDTVPHIDGATVTRVTSVYDLAPGDKVLIRVHSCLYADDPYLAVNSENKAVGQTWGAITDKSTAVFTLEGGSVGYNDFALPSPYEAKEYGESGFKIKYGNSYVPLGNATLANTGTLLRLIKITDIPGTPSDVTTNTFAAESNENGFFIWQHADDNANFFYQANASSPTMMMGQISGSAGNKAVSKLFYNGIVNGSKNADSYATTRLTPFCRLYRVQYNNDIITTNMTIGDWVVRVRTFNGEKSLRTVISGSGELDLSGHPEIININPNAFANNSHLTSIILPSTLQSFSDHELTEYFSRTTSGSDADDNYVYGDINYPQGNVGKVTLDDPVASGTSFLIKADLSFDNWTEGTSSLGDYLAYWGNVIVAAGEDPNRDKGEWGGMFQVYLDNPLHQGDSNLKICTNKGESLICTDVASKIAKTGEMKMTLSYDAALKEFYAIMEFGDEKVEEHIDGVTMDDIEALCHNLRTGMNLTISLGEDVSVIKSNDPFRGCANLESIQISNNSDFEISDDGALMHNGLLMSFPIASLYGQLVRLNLPDGNSLREACIADDNNLQITTVTSTSNRDLVGGAHHSSYPASSLFRIVNDGGPKIISVNSATHKSVYNKNNQGTTLTCEGGNPGYVAMSGSNACLVFNPEWAKTFIILPTYGEDDMQFTFMYNDNESTYLGAGAMGATQTHINVEMVRDIEVAIKGGYAAVCLPLAVQAVEGCCVATAVKNGVIELEAIKGTIPAETPFIIKSDATSVKLPLAAETMALDGEGEADEVADTKKSIFYGSCLAVAAGTHNDGIYLYDNDGGFAKGATAGKTALPSGSAYLLNANNEDWADNNGKLTLAKEFTTSIEELSTINHQSSTIYDLMGRKLAAPVKGINIIGGRKVLVK